MKTPVFTRKARMDWTDWLCIVGAVPITLGLMLATKPAALFILEVLEKLK